MMNIKLPGSRDGYNFLAFAIESEDVLKTLSVTSTALKVQNADTGAVTTFTGTGLKGNWPYTTGTFTGWTTRDANNNVVAEVTGISWPAPDFFNALWSWYSDDAFYYRSFYELLAKQPVSVDASASTEGFYWFDLNQDTQNYRTPQGSSINFIGSIHGDEFGGRAGKDTINTGGVVAGETDIVYGSKGNDTIIYSSVTPGGGQGWNDLSFHTFYDALKINIDGPSNAASIKNSSGTTTVVDIRNALSNANDGFRLFAGRGDDTITVNGGAGTWLEIVPDSGHDKLFLTLSGDIRVNYSGGWDHWEEAVHGLYLNLATGDIFNDGQNSGDSISLVQAGGWLEIVATGLNDLIVGSDSGEGFKLLSGDDSLDGGGGSDQISYDLNKIRTGVVLDFETGIATGNWKDVAFTHHLTSIEAADGSRFDDLFRGSANDELFWGNAGSDTLDGRSGGDTLYGGDGNDRIIGGTGEDWADGGVGNDYIDLGSAEAGSTDMVMVSAGDDRIIYSSLGSEAGLNMIAAEDLGAAITLDINGAANTGKITSALGTTTLVDIARAIADTTEGWAAFGSELGDKFIVDGGEDTWIIVAGGRGADSYQFNLTGNIRLVFSITYYVQEAATEGVVANLATGVISNDGFGNAETISLTQGGGRLQIRGTNHADQIIGSAGDEVFFLQGGNDTLDGGAGFDTLRYNWDFTTSGVVVDLAAGTATGNWQDGAFVHRISGIEGVRGTILADVLKGSAADDTLDGDEGNDTLAGGAGNDRLVDWDGDDDYSGGDGFDTFASEDMIYGDATFFRMADGSITIHSNLGVDHVGGDVETLELGETQLTFAQLSAQITRVTATEGNEKNNTMVGTALADVIIAGAGGDWVTPGAGADTVDGGEGVDMVSFYDATARVVVDLAASAATIAGVIDVIQNFENVTGTIYGDVITGTAGANRIRALGDYDWMVGSGGGDIFEGGTGRDTVAYSAAKGAVTASLLSATGTAGQALGDSYVDVENLTGSSFADRLTGNADRNILRGLAGDDFIFGLGGADTIDGGAGNDVIDGGLSNDRITGGKGNDLITGGQGWDTAIYSGARADYTVTTRADGSVSVLNKIAANDGLDILTTIEVLQFSDGRLFL